MCLWHARHWASLFLFILSFYHHNMLMKGRVVLFPLRRWRNRPREVFASLAWVDTTSESWNRSEQHYYKRGILIPILQKGKLRHRGVQSPVIIILVICPLHSLVLDAHLSHFRSAVVRFWSFVLRRSCHLKVWWLCNLTSRSLTFS